MPSKTFCIMPFVHATVKTNGNIHLCCVSTETSNYNIKNNDINEWWSSIDQVRKDMLSGQPLSACDFCYKQERQGVTSQRQSNNKRFKIIFEKYAEKIVDLYYKDLPTPIDYELQVTNICNLKCIMCGDSESSAVLSENKILKITNVDQRQYLWQQEEIDKVLALLQDPATRSVTFRGGEPFLIPQIKKTMIDVVNSGRAQLIDLQLVTNCTEFDVEWVDILNQFKSVWVICSIDAVGSRYEFIRYNANWQQVDKNIDLIKTIKNVNITINAVIQNINVFGIRELLAWGQQKEIYIKLSLLQEPAYLTVNVLPQQLKDQVVEELSTLDPSNSENLSNINEYLKASTELNCKLWDEFVHMITVKCNHRNVNFLTAAPEFKKYFNYAKTN
jgi:molybdenum cofactor biosynthesis enzyme MoaA